jgi:hypothetical protein
MLDPFVLSAGALPVSSRTENSLTEKTAFFRLESTVVNSLRVLDLPMAPRAHHIWSSHCDTNIIEAQRTVFTN